MKKILVIAPILAEWSEHRFFGESLGFLTPFYQLDIVDPLETLDKTTTQERFFAAWREKINTLLEKYDGFIGFSFGGVILQHCLDLFENKNKSLILFSTPTFADQTISERLNKVVDLIANDSVVAGIKKLHEYVYHPYPLPMAEVEVSSKSQASLRLTKGFKFILEKDSRAILNKTSVRYMHLIGKDSQLVNRDNVFVPSSCQLEIVPEAGMRVLQNNPTYCSAPILNFIKGHLA